MIGIIIISIVILFVITLIAYIWTLNNTIKNAMFTEVVLGAFTYLAGLFFEYILEE